MDYRAIEQLSELNAKLVRIIEVAKRGLYAASVCETDYHTGLAALDEIAKIENQ